MSEKRKILIVENQITQFNKIFENFGNEYDTHPGKEDFLKFITWVRRYVYTNYPANIREEDFSNIIEKAKDVELILMDYKLGASYMCLSGIILAQKINLELKKNGQTLPVVFMSKDEEHTKKIADELEDYKKIFPNCIWVRKGYFGDEILKPEYFQKKVIQEGIEELLNSQNNYSPIIPTENGIWQHG